MKRSAASGVDATAGMRFTRPATGARRSLVQHDLVLSQHRREVQPLKGCDEG